MIIVVFLMIGYSRKNVDKFIDLLYRSILIVGIESILVFTVYDYHHLDFVLVYLSFAHYYATSRL